MTMTTKGARRRLATLGLGLGAGLLSQPACAQDSAWTLAATYTADVAGPVSGGVSQAGKFLDNLLIEGDLDLDKALGWTGATAHVSLLNNSGGAPNDIAGTLQGIDNIEVARPRAKIYEAWAQQDFGRASVRVGIYDLNSEFYTTDAAGQLISPAFGIGSELAATGPNGPSIFPSTALALRFRLTPSDATYVQAAALNANAGGHRRPRRRRHRVRRRRPADRRGRPDSALSFGVAYGGLSTKFQQTLAAGGVSAETSESTLELTYADKVAPRLTLQPSVQYVIHPGGDRDADPALVLALRVSIDL